MCIRDSFEIDGPWKDFAAVTKLIKKSKSVHVLGHDYKNKVFCVKRYWRNRKLHVGDIDRMASLKHVKFSSLFWSVLIIICGTSFVWKTLARVVILQFLQVTNSSSLLTGWILLHAMLVSRLIGGPLNVRAAECTRRVNAKIGRALFHSLFQRDDMVGRSLYETLPTKMNSISKVKFPCRESASVSYHLSS